MDRRFSLDIREIPPDPRLVVRSDIVTGPNSQVARNSMVFIEALRGD
jgi:hypothetical protein